MTASERTRHYPHRMSTLADHGARTATPGAIHRLTPMLHVADVEASVRFYALLGLQPVNIMRDHGGRAHWVKVGDGESSLMLAAASGPVAAEDQAALLYLYSRDIATLRAHLLSSGLLDGGPFCGTPGPGDGRRVAFEITRPFYMPDGEFRVSDPDGYCLLIGQMAS